MSSSDCPRPRKARRTGHVTLTEELSSEILLESCVLVGERIRPEAGSRSDLLAGLGDTDGLAALPGDVSAEDLQLWQAVSVSGCEPSTSELVTVLKVADAIGDSHITSLIHMMGTRAYNVDWHTAADPHIHADSARYAARTAAAADAMLAALLSLPDHLLNRSLAACLVSTSLEDMLEMLPPTLHAPLVAAEISSNDGELLLCRNEPCFESSAVPLLAALAAARPPSPGLQLLTAEASCQLLPKSASAALLARALATHPALHTLSLLDRPLPHAWLATFSACVSLSGLPALTDWTINIEAAGGGCAALARCLKHLPALTRLECHMLLNQEALDADQPSAARMYIQPVASPVLLSRLQELNMREQEREDDPVRGPSSTLMQLLPLLRAPALTQLTLESAAHSLPYTAFISSLGQLSSLQSLHITGTFTDSDVRGPGRVPPVAAGCTLQLNKLSIISDDPLMQLRLVPAALASASITSLVLGAYRPYRFGAGGHSGRAAACGCVEDWTVMLECIGWCTQLQSMHLDILRAFGCEDAVNTVSEALAGALAKLPALTALSLQASHQAAQEDSARVLRAETLAGALRALSALKELTLRSTGAELRLEPHAASVLHACAALPQLSRLVLMCHGLIMDEVAEVVPSMRALQALVLPECLFQEGHAVTADTLRAHSPGLCVTVALR